MTLQVLKTYKTYIDGKFPRSESGRTYPLLDAKKKTIANICQCSKKDLKAAVVASRNALPGWSGRTAYNRSQILYRIAEMLEGRKAQFADEMKLQGFTLKQASAEVQQAIDVFVYFAGWCDKFQAVYSSVNPVASSHFNFSVPEPMGVVCMLSAIESPLAALAALIAPAICGGNTCTLLASEQFPLCAVTFSEVLATSDLPAGVVNILTGKSRELGPEMAAHLDVNALVNALPDFAQNKEIEAACAGNVKRYFSREEDWLSQSVLSPNPVMDLQEIKTTWHPIEHIGAGGSKY